MKRTTISPIVIWIVFATLFGSYEYLHFQHQPSPAPVAVKATATVAPSPTPSPSPTACVFNNKTGKVIGTCPGY